MTRKRRRHRPEQIIRRLDEVSDRVGGWRRPPRAGPVANDKRVRRLWRNVGLRVPQRCRNHRLHGIGVAAGPMCPIRPNVVWAADFQFDVIVDGRQLKLLIIIDEFTRETIAIGVHPNIDADHVVNILDRLAVERGSAPAYVRFDNGHVTRRASAIVRRPIPSQ